MWWGMEVGPLGGDQVMSGAGLGGNIPPPGPWVLEPGRIIKLTHDSWAGEKRNRVHAGYIEMRPHKWPQQAAFILSGKETKPWWGIDRTRKLGFGAQGVKNVNRLWAWGSWLKKSQGLFSQASWLDSPPLVIKISFHFRLHRDPFHRGDLFSASGKQKGVSECLSYVGCFLTNFNSQIINMPLYTFEDKLPRSPDSHESRIHRNEMNVFEKKPQGAPLLHERRKRSH